MNLQISLQEVKNYLRKNYEKGCKCPACGQNVKLYKRKLNSGMARVLIELFAEKDKVIHVKDHLRINNIKNNHDWALLGHWGLIEQQNELKLMSKDSGYWKITTLGIDFVKGRITVAKHILIYNNDFRGFSNEITTINESLGNHFNYEELMITNAVI